MYLSVRKKKKKQSDPVILRSQRKLIQKDILTTLGITYQYYAEQSKTFNPYVLNSACISITKNLLLKIVRG